MTTVIKPALIIGNGPSVDQLDPALLPHFITYGCNHISKKFPAWGRGTDNVVITDSNRIEEIGDSYRDYPGGLYIGDQRYVYPPVAKIRRIIGRDFVPLKQLKKESLDRISFLDHVCWSKYLYSTVFHRGRLSFDPKLGFNFGPSVVTSAIQLAAIAGCKTILLTGVDSSYRVAKDYFAGAEGSIGYVNDDFIKNPRIHMEPVLVLLQVYLEAMGVELIDCTPGGKLRYITKGTFTAEPPYYRVVRPL